MHHTKRIFESFSEAEADSLEMAMIMNPNYVFRNIIVISALDLTAIIFETITTAYKIMKLKLNLIK